MDDIIYAFGGIHHNSTVSEVEVWDLTTSIADEPEHTLPGRILLRNFPNPFNTSTTVVTEIPAGLEANALRYDMYDAAGRLVSRTSTAHAGPGRYLWQFNTEELPGPLPAGIYFLRLSAGSMSVTHAMLYLP